MLENTNREAATSNTNDEGFFGRVEAASNAHLQQALIANRETTRRSLERLRRLAAELKQATASMAAGSLERSKPDGPTAHPQS